MRRSAVGDGATGTTTTTDGLRKETNRTSSCGCNRASNGAVDITGIASATTFGAFANRGSKSEGRIGGFVASTSSNIRRHRTALAAATTDRLQQHAVGGITLGDEGAVGVEVDARRGTTGASGAAHRERCIQVAA